MAVTSRLVVLLVCLSAVRAADDECVCADYTDEEKNDVWEFLKKYPEGVDHEGILPAVLTPLTPCSNCIEYDRKKRTILPLPEDVDKSVETDYSESETLIEEDPRCPIGYARIGFRCVPVDDVF